MTHQCRMGYAPAIDYLPQEPRKEHVTQNRSTRNAADAFESQAWTHVGMHTVQQAFNPAAEPTMGEDGALLADASPKADADGWIKWADGKKGRKCPVPQDVNVQIKWFDGDIRAYPAYCIYGWDSATSILAYRVLPA